MRVVYDNLSQTTVAFGDLPFIKIDRQKENSKKEAKPFEYTNESIFQRLLILDSLVDNNFKETLQEAAQTVGMVDPAFHILIDSDFESYVRSQRHLAKWEKIRKDYHSYATREIGRRNKQNPYFIENV